MRLRRTALCSASSLALALTIGSASEAIADGKPTLSGSWSASGVSESWSFDNWGETCGPKPKGQGGGGGAVQIREQGGELSIIGAGRAWSTSECWEQSPGLGRVSHSQSGGGRFWRTRCSASNGNERVTVTTTVSATDSSIVMNETSEHKVTVSAELTCTATATRSRSFSLGKRDGEEPAPSASASASAQAPAPPPSSAPPSPSASPAVTTVVSDPKKPPKVCTNPGEPARLEVYPARKTLRPGDRFSFQTVVVDAEGCSLAVKPTWTSAPSATSSATVDPSGTVTIAEGAAEGRVELFAQVAGKSVPVVVEIASAANYDALLSAGKLDPQGAEQGAAIVIATGAVGGRSGVADDVGRERKQIFVAIVVGLAFVLGFVGLVLMRRGKRPTDADAETDADAAAEAEAEAETDADADTEAALQTSQKKPSTAAPGKVCPTCGARYGAEAMFCGGDGTTLVPLNC